MSCKTTESKTTAIATLKAEGQSRRMASGRGEYLRVRGVVIFCFLSFLGAVDNRGHDIHRLGGD